MAKKVKQERQLLKMVIETVSSFEQFIELREEYDTFTLEINQYKKITGPWHVSVTQPGRYRFTLRQFPKEAGKPMRAVRAKVKIGGKEAERKIAKGAHSVDFELDLPKGETTLETFLYTEKNEVGGAYFTEVKLL